MKSQVYLKNVVTLEYDATKCKGCGLCVDVCPHLVFKMENKRAVMVHRDSCMECGACQLNCNEKAIKVTTGVGCATAILMSKDGEANCTCGGDNYCCS